ncbi:Thiamin-phosphate pyrophosphorylase [Thioalkalivibrio nitratireducens DSM 14787]|uniref:Thiamine-phosphate synthase n=1 Tax=Thioalkalivibrio nitratireducens (strain DSM 14787 / UNIQEM 213 / ALEN2) TaxID=1255043 RepID=L0DZR3_THIND|nr:Thiamin-phosphate pyrophosphorylase [Thioalkalivibrio nitratireducens DSM 14787]
MRGLYFVTPDRASGRIALVAAALRGGARIIQYRDKSGTGMAGLPEARELLALCRKAGALLLINDDIELCLAAGADGVHLGEDDAGIADARTRLGPNRVIGASCYNDLDRARRALAAGADYVAFGSVYPSPTKPAARRANPGLLRAARGELSAPICAIGGITPDNAAPIIAAGADMIAVIQAISEAPNPEAAARALQALFAQTAAHTTP